MSILAAWIFASALDFTYLRLPILLPRAPELPKIAGVLVKKSSYGIVSVDVHPEQLDQVQTVIAATAPSVCNLDDLNLRHMMARASQYPSIWPMFIDPSVASEEGNPQKVGDIYEQWNLSGISEIHVSVDGVNENRNISQIYASEETWTANGVISRELRCIFKGNRAQSTSLLSALNREYYGRLSEISNSTAFSGEPLPKKGRIWELMAPRVSWPPGTRAIIVLPELPDHPNEFESYEIMISEPISLPKER